VAKVDKEPVAVTAREKYFTFMMHFRVALRMKDRLKIYLLLLFIYLAHNGLSQSVGDSLLTEVKVKDSLTFSGQASLWALINQDETYPLWLGARYLPQVDFSRLQGKHKLDVELALNINGTTAINPFSEIDFESSVKLYRSWIRYSTDQLEIRLGLQKINFGSASMLRPLMWFDRLDPRDPLQLTDGVWGLLGRYYFLNNANIWLWGLYGNERPSAWETVQTNEKVPEFGGRLQMPVPRGEVAFTFHRRTADVRNLGEVLQIPWWNDSKVPEYKLGLDGKWDLITGLWFEASFTHKGKGVGIFTNQHLLNLGADYTFGVGNGLNVTAEHLFISQDEEAFEFNNNINFTGMSANYPLGLNDNLSVILYYDWLRKNIYNFISWKKQMGSFELYTMIFLNPEENALPLSRDAYNLMGGKGIQLMIVYNH